MQNILEFRQVDYAYHSMDGEVPALKNINFTVGEEEFLVIVGPSRMFFSMVRHPNR